MEKTPNVDEKQQHSTASSQEGEPAQADTELLAF